MTGIRSLDKPSWRICLVVALMLAALASVAAPATAEAAGTVGNGAAASCTEAALDAALAGGGTVTFNCGAGAVTITITATKIITANTSIDGGGRVTISGGDAVRVFHVNQGITLDLSNITVSNGRAMQGGGIYVDRGALNVANSILSNNEGPCCSPSAGGAIFNNNGAVTIARSTVTGSYVGGSGAGLYNYNGSATITNSTFAGGGANSGGGVFNAGQRYVDGHSGSTATLTVTNSTFTNNGGSFGGALFNFAHGGGTNGTATVTITNSTLSGNSASGLGGPNLSGGALFNNGGTVTVHNSIAANSTAYANPGNCSGPIDAASSNNLTNDASCGGSFTQVASTDLQLGPLASNGGPTQTFALGAGSVAINAGNVAICALAAPNGPGGLDQRGAAHMGGCDIGAYERGVGTNTSLTSSLNPSNVGQEITFTAQVSASSGTPAGTVTFKDGASVLGTANLDSTGQATFSTSSLTAGNHAVTAVYNGQQSAGGNVDVSTSPALTQMVNRITDTLTVSTAGTGSGNVTSTPAGISCGADCTEAYDAGTVVTLTANPASGSAFTGWSGACTDASGPCTVTMDAARSVTATFTLSNRPPDAEAGSGQTVAEGSSVTLDATGSSDPDGDELTYGWSVSGGDCPAVTLQPSANIASPAFTAIDNGTCAFQVTVEDGNGGTDSDDVTVTIENEAPVVTLDGPSGGSVHSIENAVSFEGHFSDAGVLDTHTAVFNWGDGTTSDGSVIESGGSGSVHGSHSYTAPGFYTVTLTVTDKDGGTGEAVYDSLVVVDLSAGKVNGSGHFKSPSGAYPADPSFSGEIHLNLNVEYKKGGTTPSGHLQLHLHDKPGKPDLKLRATSFDWLVVSGDHAWISGTMTLDGPPKPKKSAEPSATYGFLVTLMDGEPGRHGQPDLVRVKVWDTATGGIVYDSQPGASDTAEPAMAIKHGQLKVPQPKRK